MNKFTELAALSALLSLGAMDGHLKIKQSRVQCGCGRLSPKPEWNSTEKWVYQNNIWRCPKCAKKENNE